MIVWPPVWSRMRSRAGKEHPLELRQLRYFVAISIARSFSKASEQLCIAQPALSRQIQLLEGELGSPLLLRTSRGVETTEVGIRFLERAQFVIKYVEEMRSALTSDIAEPSGEVVVGLPPSLFSHIGPRLIEKGEKKFPLVTIRVIEGGGSFLTEWLDLGRIDLSVLSSPRDSKAIAVEEMAEEELVLVGVPSQLSSNKPITEIAELGNYELGVTHMFKAVIEPWLKMNRISPSYRMELDSGHILKRLVLRGMFCTVFPFSFVHEEIKSGELVARRFVPRATRTLALARNATRPNNQAIRAVEQMVVDEVKTFIVGLRQIEPTGVLWSLVTR
jgi:LysR family transcriptional regulator, nitrogen assimilation regulatory protein